MYYLLIYLFLFPPLLRIGNVPINAMLLLPLIVLPIAISSRMGACRANWLKPLVCIVLFQIGFFLIILSISGSADYDALRLPVYSLLMIFVAVSIVGQLRISFGNAWQERMLDQLVIAGAINASIGILFYFNNSMAYLANRFVYVYDVEFLEMGSQRFSGLSSYGGATLSVVYALIAAKLLFQKWNRLKGLQYASNVICFALLTLGVIFSGRTGLVLLILVIPIALGKELYRVWIHEGKVRPFVMIPVLAGLSISALLLFFVVKTPEFESVIQWAFEFYYRYVNEGELRTSSTDAILYDQWVAPPADQMLFGNGYFGRSQEFWLPSDSGYIRMLWGSGLAGVCVSLFPLIWLWIRAIKQRDPFIVLTIAWLLMCSLKEIFFLGTFGVTQLLLMLLFVHSESGLGPSGRHSAVSAAVRASRSSGTMEKPAASGS